VTDGVDSTIRLQAIEQPLQQHGALIAEGAGGAEPLEDPAGIVKHESGFHHRVRDFTRRQGKNRTCHFGAEAHPEERCPAGGGGGDRPALHADYERRIREDRGRLNGPDPWPGRLLLSLGLVACSGRHRVAATTTSGF